MTGYEKGPQVALETLLALEDLPTKQVLHHEGTAFVVGGGVR